ncbi:tudor domain-containing protein 3-like [Penaeus monodon]|uniref:tudor domain-containing protein 3-like n=1 Tax=Penaeus monodon TaxID=6687 RepID=UPI0018A763FC|nr:tudor domain-containing protein 3-like [Penaeus monodon]
MTVTAKEVVARLKGEGWSLSEEGVENLLEGNSFSFQNASQEILNSDLKDVGAPCLPEDLKGKNKTLTGLMVLPVSKIRNVSAPKAFADSSAAPRLLRLSLTDGTNTFSA